MKRRKVFERNARLRRAGFVVVDRFDAQQGKKAFALFRRADLSVNGVAGF